MNYGRDRGKVMRIVAALLLFYGFLTGSVVAQTLQPGDTISVSVFQDPKLDRQIFIGPGGVISFPLAGHIRAAGMTPQTLENTLRARLKDKYTTDLDITVALVARKEPEKLEEEMKPRIYVMGEVQRPGPYPIRTRTSLMQAISLAGGFGPFAAKQRIQVRRRIDGIESIFQFNYRAFESGADVSGNINLQPGDVVVVPERNLIEGIFY